MMTHKSHHDNPPHNKSKRPKKKSHRLLRWLGFGVLGSTAGVGAVALGGYGGWRYINHQADKRRQANPDFNQTVSAKVYCGLVHRQGKQLTLTTAGASYQLIDPLGIVKNLLDGQLEGKKGKPASHFYQSDKQAADYIAPQQTDYTPNPYYDQTVCLLAELSPKGRYGNLGQFDYQLTVVGLPEQHSQQRRDFIARDLQDERVPNGLFWGDRV